MTNLKALEVWTAQTICGTGILLSIASCLLHLGRRYFQRVLGRLTLRVAADLWWLTYVVLRDASLFVAVLLGLWTLNLDLMADIKIGLPFVPLGTVALTATLVVKVFATSTVPGQQLRRVNAWVMIGAALNAIGYVFVMEAPGDEYVAARYPFWQAMRSLRSNVNPDLSIRTFTIAGILLAIVTAWAVVSVSRRYGSPETKTTAESESV